MPDFASKLPTGPLKLKLQRRFIAAYKRQNPDIVLKVAEPRLHLPGGPDSLTYAWEVIAVRPDKTVLTALVAAVRPKGKKRTNFVDLTQVTHPNVDLERLMPVTTAMRDLDNPMATTADAVDLAAPTHPEIPAA